MRLTKKQRMVHDYLRQLVSTGLRKGDLLPTVSELSETLKISPMTVNKAMDKAVELGLVVKRQGKGTFVGNAFENSEPLKKRTVAFVSPFMFDDIFMNDFTRGLMEGIDHERFSLFSKHVMHPVMKENVVIAETAAQADAMILISHFSTDSVRVTSHLLSNGFPIVFMDHYRELPGHVAVCVDNEDGVERIMKHLFSLGHRRIAHLTVPNAFSSTISRTNAYESCMRRNGLAPVVAIADETGIIPMELLQGTARPTAIFAQNDGLALQVVAAAAKFGLSVPEDISVVGFDDDEGMDSADPPLTTYAQPKIKIGAKCAEIIQQMLDGITLDKNTFLLKGELVERKSTAKPKMK